MRRWRFLSRLSRERRPREAFRCVLTVEELEGRVVLAPIVTAPPTTPSPENTPFRFANATAFTATDPYEDGQTYQVEITSTNGAVAVDPATAMEVGVSVRVNSPSDIVLTGSLSFGINTVLQAGVAFAPTPFFSGDAVVTVTATDTYYRATAAASTDLQIRPVADDAPFAIRGPGEFAAPAQTGFAFPPGFVSVAPWPNLTGSETGTVTLAVAAADAGGFTLRSGGTPLTPTAAGTWQISNADPAALQAELDALVLVPPAGFSGRAVLTAGAVTTDTASYADGTTATSTQNLGSGQAALRFFQGASVTTTDVVAAAGDTVDLGGLYSVADPDELPGDTHTLTLSVPGGTLAVDPAAAPGGLSVAGDDATVTLTGTVAEIDAFLAAPGGLTYTPDDPTFTGTVPVALELALQPGTPPALASGVVPDPAAPPPPLDAAATIEFDPAADPVVPSAAGATTNEDIPVATPIGLSGLADLTPAESVRVVLTNVPIGASFNLGTDLGNGQWEVAPDDLARLVFTPPAGKAGTFAIGVTVTVTDAAPGLPTDAVVESTTFDVTVVPAEVPGTGAGANSGAGAGGGAPASGPAGGPDAGGGDRDARPDDGRSGPLSLVNTYVSAASVENSIATNETRAGPAPPTPGSLFVQSEAPVPSYTLGEQHPLPPVFPLDPTLPTAAFTESGGDSFALVDALYRGAKLAPAAPAVSRAAPESHPAAPPNPAEAAEAAERTAGVVPSRTPAAGPTVPPPAAGPDPAAWADGGEAEGEWRTWAAAAVLVGSVAALVRLSGGNDGPLARAVCRFFRAARPHPLPSRAES